MRHTLPPPSKTIFTSSDNSNSHNIYSTPLPTRPDKTQNSHSESPAYRTRLTVSEPGTRTLKPAGKPVSTTPDLTTTNTSITTSIGVRTTPAAMQKMSHSHTAAVSGSTNGASARPGLNKATLLGGNGGSAAPPTIPGVLPLPLGKPEEGAKCGNKENDSTTGAANKNAGGVSAMDAVSPAQTRQRINHQLHDIQQKLSLMHADIRRMDKEPLLLIPTTTSSAAALIHHSPSPPRSAQPLLSSLPQPTNPTNTTVITTTTTTTAATLGSDVSPGGNGSSSHGTHTTGSNGGVFEGVSALAGKRQLAPLPSATNASPFLSAHGNPTSSRPHSAEKTMKKLPPTANNSNNNSNNTATHTTVNVSQQPHTPPQQPNAHHVPPLSPLAQEARSSTEGSNRATATRKQDSPAKASQDNSKPVPITTTNNNNSNNSSAMTSEAAKIRAQKSETSSAGSAKTARSPLVKVGTEVFSASRTEPAGSAPAKQDPTHAAHATKEATQAAHKTRTAPRTTIMEDEKEGEEKRNTKEPHKATVGKQTHSHATPSHTSSNTSESGGFTLSHDVHGGSLPLLESPPSSSSDDDTDSSSSSSGDSHSSSSSEDRRKSRKHNTNNNNNNKSGGKAHEGTGRGAKPTTVMTAEQYAAKAHNVHVPNNTNTTTTASTAPSHNYYSNSHHVSDERGGKEAGPLPAGVAATSPNSASSGHASRPSSHAEDERGDDDDVQNNNNGGSSNTGRDPFALSSNSSEGGAGRGGNNNSNNATTHHRAGRGVLFLDEAMTAGGESAGENAAMGVGVAGGSGAQAIMTTAPSRTAHTNAPSPGKSAFASPHSASAGHATTNAPSPNAHHTGFGGGEYSESSGETIVQVGRRHQQNSNNSNNSNNNNGKERRAMLTPTPPAQSGGVGGETTTTTTRRKEPTPPSQQGQVLPQVHRTGSAGKNKKTGSAPTVTLRVTPPLPPPVTANIPHSATTSYNNNNNHTNNNNSSGYVVGFVDAFGEAAETQTRVSFLDAGAATAAAITTTTAAAAQANPSAMTPMSIATPGSMMMAAMSGAESERFGADSANPNNTSLLLSSFNRSGMTMMQSTSTVNFNNNNNNINNTGKEHAATSPPGTRPHAMKRSVSAETANAANTAGNAPPMPRKRSLSLSFSHQPGVPQGMEKEGPQQKIRQQQHRAKRIRERFFAKFPCLSEVMEYEGLRPGATGRAAGRTRFEEPKTSEGEEGDEKEDKKKYSAVRTSNESGEEGSNGAGQESNARSSVTPTPDSMALVQQQQAEAQEEEDATRPTCVEDLFLVGAPCSWLVCIALALSYVSELPITIEDILRVNRLSVHNISLPAITLAQLYDMTMDYLTNCLYETEDSLESATSESRPLPLGAGRANEDEDASSTATSEGRGDEEEEGNNNHIGGRESESTAGGKATTTTKKKEQQQRRGVGGSAAKTKASMKACTAAEIFRGLSGLQCEMATFNSDIVDPESAEVSELRELGEHPPVTSLAQLRKELLAHINEEGSIYVFNYNPHIVEQYELRLRSNLAETEEEMAAIMASARYGATNRGNFGLLLDFSPVVHTVTIATPHLMRERYPMHDIHPSNEEDNTNTSNISNGNTKDGASRSGRGEDAGHTNSSTRDPLLTTVSELTPFLDIQAVARRSSVLPTLAEANVPDHDPGQKYSSSAHSSSHARKIDVSKIVTTDVVLEVHTIALQTFYEAVRDVDSYTMLSRGFVRIYQRFKASSRHLMNSNAMAAISGNELIAQARASVSHPEGYLPPSAYNASNITSSNYGLTTNHSSSPLNAGPGSLGTRDSLEYTAATTVVPSIFPLFVLDGSSSGGLITSTLDVTIAPHILGLCVVHHLAITFLLSDSARRRQSSRNLLSKANVCDVKLRGIPLTKICQQLHLPMSMIVSESRKDAIAMAFAWYSVFLRQLQIHHEVHIGLVTPTRRDDAEDGQPSLSEEDFLAHLKLVVRTASIMLIGFNVNRALNVTVRPVAEPFHCAVVVGVDEQRGVVRLADVNVKRFRKTWHLPIARLYNATMGYGYLVAAKEKRTIKSLHGKADAARALTNARYALPPQISTGLARFEYPARPYPITVLADAVERLGFEGTTVERFMNFSGFHITYFLSRHMSLEGAAAVAQNYSHYALDDAMSVVVTHYDYYEGHLPSAHGPRRPLSACSSNNPNAKTTPTGNARPTSSNTILSTTSVATTAFEESYAALHRVRTVEDDLIPALQFAMQSPTTRKLLVNFDHAVVERYTEVWNGGQGGSFAIVLHYDPRSRLVTLMDANVNSFYRVFAWPVTVLFEAICSFDTEGLRARGTLLLSKDSTQEAIYENSRGYDLAHALVHHPFRPIFSAPCSCLALAATEMMMNIALPDNYVIGARPNGQRLSMSSQSLNREAERKKYQRYSNIFSAEDFLYAVPAFSVHDWQAERVDTKDMTGIANDAFKALHLPLTAINILEQSPDLLSDAQAFLQACRGTSGLVTIVMILYDTDKIHGVPGTSMGLVNRVDDLIDDMSNNNYSNNNNNNEEEDEEAAQDVDSAQHRRTRSLTMTTTQGGTLGRVQLVEGDPCRWGTYCERTAEEWMPAVLAIVSIEPAEELESQWII